MLIGYVRGEPRDKRTSLERAALRAAGCQTVFADRSVRRDLPELERALGRLRTGDVLVVSELAKLGHALIDVLQIVQRVEARGAHLRSIGDGIDTTAATNTGTVIFRALGALAAVERQQRGERARRGMSAARQRGTHVGRPPKLQEDEVRSASKRIEAGEEPADVARSLGVSALTLRRNLQALRDREGDASPGAPTAENRRSA